MALKSGSFGHVPTVSGDVNIHVESGQSLCQVAHCLSWLICLRDSAI
ncbi:hypothetical protein JMJ77_0003520, partial [Colletotrichum scovillei]